MKQITLLATTLFTTFVFSQEIKDIEDYKKKIAEAEQKIKDDEAASQKKEGEIGTQTTKLGEVEGLLKKIK